MTVSGSGQSITRETNCDVPLLSPATVHSQLVSAVNCRNPINMVINNREGLKHTGHMGHLGVCLNLQPNSIVFCTEYNCTITSQWCNKINKAVKYLIQISIFFVDSKYMIVSRGIITKLILRSVATLLAQHHLPCLSISFLIFSSSSLCILSFSLILSCLSAFSFLIWSLSIADCCVALLAVCCSVEGVESPFL